jgi:hypothetical protein
VRRPKIWQTPLCINDSGHLYIERTMKSSLKSNYLTNFLLLLLYAVNESKKHDFRNTGFMKKNIHDVLQLLLKQKPVCFKHLADKIREIKNRGA